MRAAEATIRGRKGDRRAYWEKKWGQARLLMPGTPPRTPPPPRSRSTAKSCGITPTTRPPRTTLGVGLTLVHGYNAAGLRTSTTATIGTQADFQNVYAYDYLNRLKQVTQQGQSGGNAVLKKQIDLTYDMAGQFDTIARSYVDDQQTVNEVATADYTFDHAGRLTGLSYAHGQTAIVTHGWTFDAAGRITQYANSTDGTVTYTNDDTGQLTAADYSGGQTDEAYLYDANGNRVTANGATYATDASRPAPWYPAVGGETRP
jgi:hypothetical protein